MRVGSTLGLFRWASYFSVHRGLHWFTISWFNLCCSLCSRYFCITDDIVAMFASARGGDGIGTHCGWSAVRRLESLFCFSTRWA